MGIRNWSEGFLNDLRYGVRHLRKTPGFTAVAVTSLALGIGANAAIFTLLDAMLFKSLPVRDPDGLVLLGDASRMGVVSGQVGSFSLFSHDLYKQLRHTDVLNDLCAFQSESGQVSVRRSGSTTAQPVGAKLVSGNYFDVLGVSAAMGRAIIPTDDLPSSSPVGVVSFAYWTAAFNSDPSAIGSTVHVNGVPVTIIGVAPADFFGETLQPDPPSVWLPLAADRQLNPTGTLVDDPDSHLLFLMGRRKDGVSTAAAETRLTTALQTWLLSREGTALSEDRRREISQNRVAITPGGGGVGLMQRGYSQTLLSLLGISMAVLVITCANIANLLLARGTARRADAAVRLALGASRGRLMRQSLTESLLLALCGGALALLVATAGTRLLLALLFRTAHVPIRIEPDFTVLGFTFALSCVVALLFGLLPALRIGSAIGTEMKTISGRVKGSGFSQRRFGLGHALVIGEIALAMIVLSGSGLLVQSLANITGQEFGFDREHVLMVDVDLSLARYEYGQLGPLYQQISERLNAVPGVHSASLSFYSPFNGCCWGFSIGVLGRTPRPGERMVAMLNRVSPRYFETLGTRVVRGRPFDQRDTATSPHVAVVNEAFVQRYLRSDDPIGQRFGVGGIREAGDLEIVGVVENAKYAGPRRDLMPMAFLALLQLKADASAQSPMYRSNFVNVIEVRATGSPTALAGQVRRVMTEVAPAIPVLRVETLSEHIDRAVNAETVMTHLAVFFGLVALALACLGLYGLMAYMVQQRTSEIGIRIALGATRGAVIGTVIREAAAQGALGILLGIPTALAATQLMTSQLYGVTPTNPMNLAAVTFVVVLCIVVAAYLPARRASKVDPISTLRQQ